MKILGRLLQKMVTKQKYFLCSQCKRTHSLMNMCTTKLCKGCWYMNDILKDEQRRKKWRDLERRMNVRKRK